MTSEMYGALFRESAPQTVLHVTCQASEFACIHLDSTRTHLDSTHLDCIRMFLQLVAWFELALYLASFHLDSWQRGALGAEVQSERGKIQSQVATSKKWHGQNHHQGVIKIDHLP